jgi:hypothetical protein
MRGGSEPKGSLPLYFVSERNSVVGQEAALVTATPYNEKWLVAL